MGGTLEANFEQIDTALSAFVAEMKAQGRWEDVTVVSTSEFGRTITSNGGSRTCVQHAVPTIVGV